MHATPHLTREEHVITLDCLLAAGGLPAVNYIRA